MNKFQIEWINSAFVAALVLNESPDRERLINSALSQIDDNVKYYPTGEDKPWLMALKKLTM